MASFTIAYEKYVKPIEGGYVNEATDLGGETYAGITRKNYPTNAVWEVIDKIKKTRPLKRNEKILSLDPMVFSFYKSMFERNGFDKIKNQDLANIIFDWFVNSGSLAFKTNSAETFGVDEILNKYFGFNLPLDGRLDSATINAINFVNPKKLYELIRQKRIEFYNQIVKDNPKQSANLKGWLNRIENFPTTITFFSVSFLILIICAIIFLK